MDRDKKFSYEDFSALYYDEREKNKFKDSVTRLLNFHVFCESIVSLRFDLRFWMNSSRKCTTYQQKVLLKLISDIQQFIHRSKSRDILFLKPNGRKLKSTEMFYFMG